MSDAGKYLVILRGGNIVVHRMNTYEEARDYVINNGMKDAWIAYMIARTPPVSLNENKEAIKAVGEL